MSFSRSVILIGMPGAGKSTLGVQLAKMLALPFVDTDLLLQAHIGGTLQQYLDTHGYRALRALEAQVLLNHAFAPSVIATGGSVVYSPALMARFAQIGVRVYLKAQLSTILQRVDNRATRGLACPPDMSLEDLYRERQALYESYADAVVAVDQTSTRQILTQICQQLGIHS